MEEGGMADPSRPHRGRESSRRPPSLTPGPGAALGGREGERLSSMRRAEDLHAVDRPEEVEIEDTNSRDRDL